MGNLSPEQENVLYIVNRNTKEGIGTTAEIVQDIIHTGRPDAVKLLQTIANKSLICLGIGAHSKEYFSTNPEHFPAEEIFKRAKDLGIEYARKMKRREILDEIAKREHNLFEIKIKSAIDKIESIATPNVWRFLYLSKMRLNLGGEFRSTQEIAKADYIESYTDFFTLKMFDKFPARDLINVGLAKLIDSRDSNSGATHYDTYEFVPYFEEILDRIDVKKGDPTPKIIQILEYEIQEGNLPEILTLIQDYNFSTNEAETYLAMLKSNLDHSGAKISSITESLPNFEQKVIKKADEILHAHPKVEVFTLYLLLTKFQCDFVLAEAVAQYLWVKGLIQAFPRAPVGNEVIIPSISSNVGKPFIMVKGNRIYCEPYKDNLWELDLDGKKINRIPEIEGLNKLSNLGNLRLSDNQISEISGLEHLINLRHLHLRNNKITKIAGLDMLTNLTELYLNHNLIKKVSGLDTLIELTKIDLGYNKIGNLEDVLPGIQNLLRLSILDLEGNSSLLANQIDEKVKSKKKEDVAKELLKIAIKSQSSEVLPPSEPSRQKYKILFLSARPTDTPEIPGIPKEFREIREVLLKVKNRDNFEFVTSLATRVSDLQRELDLHEPHIVHFSGHGSDEARLMLEDNEGKSVPVTDQSLGTFFKINKGNIRCVVLNACFSEPQARAIAEHIDCAIGMSDKIRDDWAISFATAFYEGIGNGKDVNNAFERSCSRLEMENTHAEHIPKLFSLHKDAKTIKF